MDKILAYRVSELEKSRDDHEIRVRALELGYAKLMVLAAVGAAIGSFLANKVF